MKDKDRDEDRGVLVCGCGDSPASEPMHDKDLNIYSALCPTCRDWSDFKYEL